MTDRPTRPVSNLELAMAEYRRKAGWDGHPEAIEAVWSLAYRSSREDAAAGPSAEHRERDHDVLAMVGRMYLDALDSDPDNEMLTLPQAMLVTEVRDAVERRERSWVEVDGSTDV